MADRFWIGGTGNWNDSAHWSTSSGGSGGASVPTSADNVYFDANSFSAEGQTVTVNVTANCLDMDWTGATNSPTLAGSSTLNVYGSLNFTGLTTLSFTGPKNFRSTSAGKTITMAGKSITGGNITFIGIGGEWTLQDDLTTSAVITLVNGILNTNGKLIDCAAFQSSNAFIRSLILGNSVIVLSQNWTFTDTTNLTLNTGTSTIKLIGNVKTFAGGGLTYHNLELQGNNCTITGSNTIH